MKEFPEEKAKEEHNKRQKKFSREDLNTVVEKGKTLLSTFKNNKKLSGFIDDFKLLFAMTKDYAAGKYKSVPWHIIASIGATLLYVALPFDIIPDFIPGVGFIDDASIFAFCLKMVSTEVEKYKTWKAQQVQTGDIEPSI